MMTIKAIRLLHMLSYLLVTSQVLFYLFILSDAFKLISLDNFFEQRKIIDALMIGRFKLMYYSCLALSVLAVVLSIKNPGTSFFITSALALVFLVIDFWIIIKGSLPLNALAHTYGETSENVNWEAIRIQWLDYMKYRGISVTLGMAGLFAGLVFGKN